MRTFTKILVAALLSTTLSGAVIAAVDLNDPTVLADDVKLKNARGIIRATQIGGLEYEVTLDANLVDSFMVLDTARFSANGGQVRNLLDGMKALYTDLASAAGDADKLKAKLSGTPLVARLILDTSAPSANYHHAINAFALKALNDAVIDDPFRAIDESFLALQGTPKAIKPTVGSGVYTTFGEAIRAYISAKTSKDHIQARAVSDEIHRMRDEKGRSFQEILADEAERDWTTSEVRAEKAKLIFTKD
ncbi:MAG: hypothetical protein K2Q34_07640 [Alphaproteobacteria bacterium]|nr:hypothetical protein [Alphaproteobacteria bacterium]